MSKTVLVVGGSGVFGSRLVERLAESTECTVLVAGRSPAKAQQLIDSLGTRQLSGVLRPMQLDRERVTTQELRDSGACVVVDAAGPFQAWQPHLAQAAIAAGCHFIDLADAREHVARFPQLDALARAHSVLAVCGASTSPALSHAVLDELAAQMGPPGEIVIAISPGWELLAFAGHGPYVPTLPALALLRRLLTGSETRRGAMACVGLLGVGEILAEATGLEIRTQRWMTATQPLFQRALASDFERMPAPVRALHSPRGSAAFRGLADVEAAANPVAHMIARCLRFPAAASQVVVEVNIQAQALRERWQRRFGDSRFSSVLACDAGAGVLTETFGPIRCTLQVSADEQGLQLAIQAAHLGCLPLPRWLTPWTRASEWVDALGRFNFDVEIGLPGIGRLVRYRGWLAQLPDAKSG